jgi:hypothetical protein
MSDEKPVAPNLEPLLNPGGERVSQARAALERLPQGHPAREALVDEIVRHTPAPVSTSVSINDDDSRRQLKTGMVIGSDQDALLSSLENLGIDATGRFKIACAISGAPAEANLSEEECEARFRTHWGDRFDDNLDLADLAWSHLRPAARGALSPRRGSKDVADALVKLGRRLLPKGEMTMTKAELLTDLRTQIATVRDEHSKTHATRAAAVGAHPANVSSYEVAMNGDELARLRAQAAVGAALVYYLDDPEIRAVFALTQERLR